MNSRDFEEAWQYHKKNPVGRDWEQTDMICRVIAQANGQKGLKPGHFIPKYKRNRHVDRMTPQQMADEFEKGL